MDRSAVRHRLEAREDSLSPFAAKSKDSRGREKEEEESPLRTAFQRDRDRIIHSHGFRRLKHKTQVFVAPLGDHFVTRLTHTVEVAQVGRTIARALNLNEDLVEAMCLGHDLGHTPFGHAGEKTLDDIVPGGFRHSSQSLRLADVLEKNGEGLNLTWEVRQGILHHSKPRGDFLTQDVEEDLTLEAQVCRVSDAVAYLNHDIGDAVRAGLLREQDLPSQAREALGQRHSQRIDTIVTDIVTSSWAAAGEGDSGSDITMSATIRDVVMELREFLFEHIYLPISTSEESREACQVVEFLYNHLCEHPDEVPPEYWLHAESTEQAVVDYVSGMTDRFALRLADELHPGLFGDSLRTRV
ncbi:MAG: dGTPase [Chloroflexi bacterium]|jgi:dGTPase|nr:MAG: dGTPase [Chloroflexota bacterium]